jgi:hypothetical protein
MDLIILCMSPHSCYLYELRSNSAAPVHDDAPGLAIPRSRMEDVRVSPVIRDASGAMCQ